MTLVVKVVPVMDLGMDSRSGMVGIGIRMKIVIDLVCFSLGFTSILEFSALKLWRSVCMCYFERRLCFCSCMDVEVVVFDSDVAFVSSRLISTWISRWLNEHPPNC